MTAEEIYESVTNGGASDFAQDELDLLRIAEASPDLRQYIPRPITSQLKEESQ